MLVTARSWSRFLFMRRMGLSYGAGIACPLRTMDELSFCCMALVTIAAVSQAMDGRFWRMDPAYFCRTLGPMENPGASLRPMVCRKARTSIAGFPGLTVAALLV